MYAYVAGNRFLMVDNGDSSDRVVFRAVSADHALAIVKEYIWALKEHADFSFEFSEIDSVIESRGTDVHGNPICWDGTNLNYFYTSDEGKNDIQAWSKYLLEEEEIYVKDPNQLGAKSIKVTDRVKAYQ